MRITTGSPAPREANMLAPHEGTAASASTDSLNRRRRSRAIVGLAAATPAALYMLYVAHYSQNVPRGDDWNLIPVAAGARSHHLSLSDIWMQYSNNRIPLVKLTIAASGYLDHLNLWHLILLSAGLHVASFLVMLLTFRSYVRRPVTALDVLALGAIWFSVADVENSLWAFQVGWYLVLFFLAVMTSCLVLRHKHPNICFTAAIVVAMLAPLGGVQGFAMWPVGLICILWARPRGRRTYGEIAIWLCAAALIVAVYVHNFDFTTGKAVCELEGGNAEKCGFAYGLSHPLEFGKFAAALAGNVVPTLPGTYVNEHAALGAVIWLVAGYVIAQSVRRRRSQPNPLPVAIILFASQFDLMIAMSRFDQGALASGRNWYTMPNVLLLFGIVVYAFGHIPDFSCIRERDDRRPAVNAVLFCAFACFLVFQCIAATNFGLGYGRVVRDNTMVIARVITNLDRLPATSRDCYMGTAVGATPPFYGAVRDARLLLEQHHLSLFSGSVEDYRRLGPSVISACDKPTGTEQPR